MGVLMVTFNIFQVTILLDGFIKQNGDLTYVEGSDHIFSGHHQNPHYLHCFAAQRARLVLGLVLESLGTTDRRLHSE